MTGHSLWRWLLEALLPAEGRALSAGGAGKAYLIAWGKTVPTAGSRRYATGCIFIHTDGGAATCLYANKGTEASCDFGAVTVA